MPVQRLMLGRRFSESGTPTTPKLYRRLPGGKGRRAEAPSDLMTDSEGYVQLGRFAAERLDNRWPVAEDELGSVRSGILKLLQMISLRIKNV